MTVKETLDRAATQIKVYAGKTLNFAIKVLQSRTMLGGALINIAIAIKGTPFDVPFFEKSAAFLNSTALALAAIGTILLVVGRLFASGPMVELGKKLEEADDAPNPADDPK